MTCLTLNSFSGFPEDDDKEARKNKLAQSKKWTMPSLKDLCQLLGLDKSGDKVSNTVEQTCNMLCVFLYVLSFSVFCACW